MTAHYKEPILLIEFDEKKSFNLEVSWLSLTALPDPSLTFSLPPDIYRGSTSDLDERV